jgi:hypothetical protein
MVNLLEAADLGIGPAVATHAAETSETNGHRKRAVRSDKGVSRGRLTEAMATVQPSGKIARGVLYFDIETIPDYSRFEQFGLEPIPEPAKRATLEECVHGAGKFLDATVEGFKANLLKLNPCDEYLDQLEIAEKAAPKPRKGILDLIADVRNQDAARLTLIEQQRKEMAVCPEMNRVVALGWGYADGPVQSLVVGQQNEIGSGPPDELHLLEMFWQLLAAASPVVGFNILGFDLPTIYIRSMLLDVKPSRRLDLKPWGSDCVDLMAVRFPKSSAKRLKWLAAAMGIEVPAGDVDGSQVEELWKSDPAKVGEYVRSDVAVTRELHQMYRGFFC